MSLAHEEETFYEVLKVDARATVSEIVAAYHAAKNAFSKDSVATYSLFNPDEVQEVIKKLEEAYQTLSNLERRAEYDRRLLAHSRGEAVPNNMTELERIQNAGQRFRSDVRPESRPDHRLDTHPTPLQAAAQPAEMGTEGVPLPAAQLPAETVDEAAVSGDWLRQQREKRGLSQDDVARITKIPSRFLKAIETDEFRAFPARVYVQGFVKNLATLYRVDPDHAMKAYLAFWDRNAASVPK